MKRGRRVSKSVLAVNLVLASLSAVSIAELDQELAFLKTGSPRTPDAGAVAKPDAMTTGSTAIPGSAVPPVPPAGGSP